MPFAGSGIETAFAETDPLLVSQRHQLRKANSHGGLAQVEDVAVFEPDVHGRRFQPVIGIGGGGNDGGTVHFRVSGCHAECGPGTSILVGGEEAGANLQFGCRMGICHTCTCRKTAGAVQNILTSEVSDEEDEDIQLCVSVPAGDVALEL